MAIRDRQAPEPKELVKVTAPNTAEAGVDMRCQDPSLHAPDARPPSGRISPSEGYPVGKASGDWNPERKTPVEVEKLAVSGEKSRPARVSLKEKVQETKE